MILKNTCSYLAKTSFSFLLLLEVWKFLGPNHLHGYFNVYSHQNKTWDNGDLP